MGRPRCTAWWSLAGCCARPLASQRPVEQLTRSLSIVRGEFEPSGQRLRAALDSAYRSSSQLGELVNRLAELARFESGIELAMEEVDLRQIIRGAVDSVKPQAAERGIPVAYAPEALPPTVRTNPPRLEQVLLSLMHNAIRMSESGSPVVVTAVAQSGEVTVQVTDQGPGIPSSDEPQLFAKRAPRLLPDKNPGDLELYLSRKIIEARGGRMGVRSQLGVGSTFYFSLPLVGKQPL